MFHVKHKIFRSFTFVEMSQSEKERTIRRNLDFLLMEFPGYIKRLESLESNFDANVGWKEFKFCFKLGTGQIVRNDFNVVKDTL